MLIVRASPPARVGTVSDPAYRRAYQRLAQLRKLGLFQAEPVDEYPGEVPALITRAYALAEEHGLTMPAPAQELSYRVPRLRLLLGQETADHGRASVSETPS